MKLRENKRTKAIITPSPLKRGCRMTIREKETERGVRERQRYNGKKGERIRRKERRRYNYSDVNIFYFHV